MLGFVVQIDNLKAQSHFTLQEGEVTAPNPNLALQHKPKTSPEVKPKPCAPLPVTAPAILEEEDEGDKIMSELQVGYTHADILRWKVEVHL